MSLVITRAYIVDEDQRRLPFGHNIQPFEYAELGAAGLVFATPEFPWCAGRLLVPHYVYSARSGERQPRGRDRIPIKGFLGWISRGGLWLSGGP